MTDEIIYTPAQVSSLTLNALEGLQQRRDSAVAVGVPGLKDDLKTLRPGTLTTIIALSSNWKSGLMQVMAREEAKRLDPLGNEAVIFCTWEVAVEEMGVFDLAHVAALDISDLLNGDVSPAQWDSLRAAAIKRASLPIYVIGHSLERRRKRQHLTMTNVALAIRSLEDDFNIKPRVSFLDYLQRIEPDRDDLGEPRIQHSRNVDRAKDMSLATGAPVVLGCQAKQEVMSRDNKLPRLNDGMETSNVMHSSDNIVTLWRPYVTEGEGAEIQLFGDKITVTEDLLIAHIAKQKFGRVGRWWPLKVDFARNKILGLYDYSL